MTNFGFIGAGQMASAIHQRLVESGIICSTKCFVYDPSIQQIEKFCKLYPAVQSSCNEILVEQCDVVLICVKPQYVKSVLAEVSGKWKDTLCISIAAGISIKTLKESTPEGPKKVIRVMPNTPCLVGESAMGWCCSPDCTEEDKEIASRLLNSLGIAYQVPENQLHAVTGVSGSGPAYVYLMIEAMADGGVRSGLPREIALKLAAQTLLGSAKMVLETGMHPGELKDAVASPGGTTIAGIHALEEGRFRATIMNAVNAAVERSKELSKE